MHSEVCQKGCSGVFIQPEMLYHFRYRGERASGQRGVCYIISTFGMPEIYHNKII